MPTETIIVVSAVTARAAAPIGLLDTAADNPAHAPLTAPIPATTAPPCSAWPPGWA